MFRKEAQDDKSMEEKNPITVISRQKSPDEFLDRLKCLGYEHDDDRKNKIDDSI